MTQVFISYSRKDSDFVQSLHRALEDARRKTWVDWEGIPPSAEWLKRICSTIDEADTFVFVLILRQRVLTRRIERPVRITQKQDRREFDSSVTL